jgi:(p)ppGpp synthase/HD superfamily hydrolase
VSGTVEQKTSQTASPRLTPLFVEAMAYAAEKHGHQARKGSDIPYLGHLLSVTGLVIEADGSETQAIAALLHDAAEDQGGEATLAEIRQKFGDEVASIVDECGDTFETPKPPWRERKQKVTGQVVAGSQGRPSASMTRTSMRRWPCLAAVDR